MDTLKSWRLWEQYYGALYDIGRGGYGSGLPLVLWEHAAEGPEAATPPPLGAQKDAASSSACGVVHSLLAAWAEGRDASSPSALSISWAAAQVSGPVSVQSNAAFKALCRASHRARQGMVSNHLIPILADVYLGKRSTLPVPLAANFKRPAFIAKGAIAFLRFTRNSRSIVLPRCIV